MQRQTFSEETFRFLSELRINNNRTWFGENKDRYESCVVDPAFAFIGEMGERLQKISQYFDAIPKKQGGSLMRIYRDTRFSKDKTPCKTNIGIQFRHKAGKDIHAPGYYVHIEPGECFLGIGIWHSDAEALKAIRERIVNRADDWNSAISAPAFRRTFERQGYSLARPPRGFDADAPFIEDLKRKDHVAVMSIAEDVVIDAGFSAQIAKSLVKATPFMQFLCKAVNVPF